MALTLQEDRSMLRSKPSACKDSSIKHETWKKVLVQQVTFFHVSRRTKARKPREFEGWLSY